MHASTGRNTSPRFRSTAPRPRPKGRAFTLIEVLVVVAIIALLVSILLPSLRQARQVARRTMCNTNMHDLGISLNTYAQENEGYFPPTPYLGSTPTSGGPWGPADDNLFILWYRKYARNIQSFSCPATTYRVRQPERIEKVAAVNGFGVQITTAGVVGRNDFEHIAQMVSNKGFGTSYEYNGWYNRGDENPVVNWYFAKPANWKPSGWNGDKLLSTKVLKPAPSRTFIMHDADESGDVLGAPPSGADNNYPEPWDNHGAKGMNILFVDAHAELVLRDRVDNVWAWKNE